MLQSIRVYNMKVEVKSSREAAVYLYDNLLKPALTNPVTGAHPGPFTAIEYCHLLPASPENREKFPGFNYIIKFNSRFWKFLFFELNGDEDVEVSLQATVGLPELFVIIANSQAQARNPGTFLQNLGVLISMKAAATAFM